MLKRRVKKMAECLAPQETIPIINTNPLAKPEKHRCRSFTLAN